MKALNLRTLWSRKQCLGWSAKKKAQCPSYAWPFSKYCWHHQDKTNLLVGLGLGIAGVLATLAVGAYQERSPELRVSFSVSKDGDPSRLQCVISNIGRAESRDIILSFNEFLPLDTVIVASPELNLRIQESESLPDPQIEPEFAKLQKAFTVHIPRIAAKDTLSFEIATTNPDNRRAAEQTMRIRKTIEEIFMAFGKRLSEKHPEESRKWSYRLTLAARIKNENFFRPDRLSYERGRISISRLTEEEQAANAINSDCYSHFKKEFSDIYQNRPEFLTPVLRIKSTGGNTTLACYPPYVNTSVFIRSSLQELKEKGELTLYPPVPESYDFTRSGSPTH